MVELVVTHPAVCRTVAASVCIQISTYSDVSLIVQAQNTDIEIQNRLLVTSPF